MSRLFTTDFLEKVAIEKLLSRAERNMFIFIFGEELNYEQIQEEYDISRCTAQGQMRRIYNKFGMKAGNGRGKEEKLRNHLLQLKEEHEKREQEVLSRQRIKNSDSSLSAERLGDFLASEVAKYTPFERKDIVSRLAILEELVHNNPQAIFQKIVAKVPWKEGKTFIENIQDIYALVEKEQLPPQIVLQNLPMFVEKMSVLVKDSEEDIALHLLDSLIKKFKDTTAKTLKDVAELHSPHDGQSEVSN